ncbi:hypothetical protein CHLRE_01g012200v5 [Chlamydomonas reinhardtii]|uniref:SBP-type domain-containing protein n=1 Tax=Chlamydomonas reinhardtii TaxID=3055 RepID=A0A2K3E5L7_CHLRE|nr:uncharacterized protein CHLRE_01g012200v5 [Chlamydomonas reinhardtii]PNW88053.1 hypothetical protein CHLRE_01g012200v5 [Chlamydomonas reinhardtii]
MALPPDPEAGGAQAFVYRDASARGMYAGLAPHFNDRRLSDIVILRPDGRSIYAHQVVLAACSRKFSNVFGHGEATGKELPIQGVDSEALELVLSSFYRGECKLTPTTVVPIYDVCLKLEVPGLTSACEQFLQRSMGPDTCCMYLEAALAVLLEHTVKMCLSYAKDRFEEIAAAPSFLRLSTKSVRLLLTSTRNSGSGINDISLARALARWAVSKPDHLSECESIFKELNVTTTALLQLLQSADFVHALQGQQKPGTGQGSTAAAGGGGGGSGGAGGGGSTTGRQPPPPLPRQQQQQAGLAAPSAAPQQQQLQQQQIGAGHGREGDRGTFGYAPDANSRDAREGAAGGGGMGNGRLGGASGSPAHVAGAHMQQGQAAGTGGPPPPHAGGHSAQQQLRNSPMLASGGSGSRAAERGGPTDYGEGPPGGMRPPAAAAGTTAERGDRYDRTGWYSGGGSGAGRGLAGQAGPPGSGLTAGRPGGGRSSPPPPFGRQSHLVEHAAGAGAGSERVGGIDGGPFQRRSLPSELLAGGPGIGGGGGDDDRQAYARRYGGGSDRAAPDSELAGAAATTRGGGGGGGGSGGGGGGERDNLVAVPLPVLEQLGLTVRLTSSGALAATGGPLGSKQVPLSVSGSGRSGPLMAMLPAGLVKYLQQVGSGGPMPYEAGGGSGRSGAGGAAAGRLDDGSPPLPPGLLPPQQHQQQPRAYGSADRALDRNGGSGLSPHAAGPSGRGGAGLGPHQRSSLDMLSTVAASAEEEAGFVDIPGLPRLGQTGGGRLMAPRSASLGLGGLATEVGASGGRSGRFDLLGLGGLAPHLTADGGVAGRWSVPGAIAGTSGSLLPLGGSLGGPGDLLGGGLNGGSRAPLGGMSKRQRPSPEDLDPDHEEPGLGLGGAGGGRGGGLTPGGGARARGGGGYGSKGPLLCHVDDCNVDLSSLKEYHQRFRICDFHLKAEVVLREGIPQRFCQQCGRFHLLSEFDGTKRSCRARLQRHNARRRKRPDQRGDSDDVPRRRPVYQTMRQPPYLSAGVAAGNMALAAAAAAAAGVGAPLSGGDAGGLHIPDLTSLPPAGSSGDGPHAQLPLDLQQLLAQQHTLPTGGVAGWPDGWPGGGGTADDADGDGDYDAEDNGGPSGDDAAMEGTPEDGDNRFTPQQLQQQQQAGAMRGGGSAAAGSGIRSQIIRDILMQAEERQQSEQQQRQQAAGQGQGQQNAAPPAAASGARASLLDLAMAVRAQEGEARPPDAAGGTAGGGRTPKQGVDMDQQQSAGAARGAGLDGRSGAAGEAADTDGVPPATATAGGGGASNVGDGNSPRRPQQPSTAAMPQPPPQAPSPPPAVKIKLEPTTSADVADGARMPADAAATATSAAGDDTRAAAAAAGGGK